jgi:hypothetical protein
MKAKIPSMAAKPVFLFCPSRWMSSTLAKGSPSISISSRKALDMGFPGEVSLAGPLPDQRRRSPSFKIHLRGQSQRRNAAQFHLPYLFQPRRGRHECGEAVALGRLRQDGDLRAPLIPLGFVKASPKCFDFTEAKRWGKISLIRIFKPRAPLAMTIVSPFVEKWGLKASSNASKAPIMASKSRPRSPASKSIAITIRASGLSSQ